ncbi:MAG TPA: DUF3078 domain-containing protein [Fibrobacter sp.]|nr:DUF3078 domain-containing protein [Fibrobacter sp.]
MKSSIYIALAFLLGFSSLSFAEGDGMFAGALPENWKADVVATAKYSRNHFSNWKDGGTNTNTWQLQYDADIKGQWAIVDWRNVLNLAWGQTYSEGIGTRKSQDKIFFESSVDFNVYKQFKPYAGVRYETQFVKGYEYTDSTQTPVSTFMDPCYLTQFVGIKYIPNENFSQGLAFANRMTISKGYGYADDESTTKFESFKDEPGLESVTEFKYAFSQIMSFKTRLWGFVNFEGVKEIDGRWENALQISITPFLELSIGIDLAYDKDFSENSQYRDIMNFGLTWRWF